MLRRWMTGLRVVAGAALLWYVLTRAGIGGVAGRLTGTPWILPGLVGLTLVGAAIEARRLSLLYAAQSIEVRFGLAYRLVAVATFFNFWVPGGTGGDVAKLYYLGMGNRGRGVEVATVLLVDRVIAAFALLALVLGLSLLQPASTWGVPALRVLLLVVLAVVVGVIAATALAWSASLRRSRFYGWMMARMPLRAHVTRALDALYAFRERRGAVLAAALLSLVGHGGLMVMFAAIGHEVLPNVTPVLTGVLAMMGMVANALPITPGGLGVGEAAFAQLFGLAGQAGGAVLLLGWRLGMLPLGIVGGLLYMAGAASYRRVPELAEVRTPSGAGR